MTCLVVGYDGSAPSDGARWNTPRDLARLIGQCELRLVFVIEWSPYSFHTPQELEERHKRREDEISRAHKAVLDPAVAAAKAEGFEHDVGSAPRRRRVSARLDRERAECDADHHRTDRRPKGVRDRLFGGVSGNLVASATVPVTIIP